MPTFRVFPAFDSTGTAGWSGTGTLLHEQLDEDPHDSDTSYIEAGGLQPEQQRFTMQPFGLPSGTIINSLSLVAVCKRVDDGQNVINFLLRTYLDLAQGRFLVASVPLDVPSAYASLTYTSATSPGTGLAWSVEEVARLFPEIEVSQNFDFLPRVPALGRFTQLYADVNFTIPTWTQRVSGGVTS